MKWTNHADAVLFEKTPHASTRRISTTLPDPPGSSQRNTPRKTGVRCALKAKKEETMKGRPKTRIALTERESSELRELAQSRMAAPAVAIRAKIVLACVETGDNTRVADMHGVSERTVRKWLARFNSDRIPGLYDAPRSGAPRRIDDRVVGLVKVLSGGSVAVQPSVAQIALASGISRSTVTRIRNSIGGEKAAPSAPRPPDTPPLARSARIIGVYVDSHVKVVVLAIDESGGIDSRAEIIGNPEIGSANEVRPLERAFHALLTEIRSVDPSSVAVEADRSVADFVDVMCRSAHASELHVFVLGNVGELAALVSARQRENARSHVHALRDDLQLGRRMADAVYGHTSFNRSLSTRPMPCSLVQALAAYVNGDANSGRRGFFCWIRTHDDPMPHRAPWLAAPAAGSDVRNMAEHWNSGRSVDDLMLAFEMAPIGLLVTRRRIVETYNLAFSNMFGYDRDALKGRSLESLYPSPEEFWRHGQRMIVALRNTDFYSDERIMRRIDNTLFWCHVAGRALNRDDPFATAVWTCEDISTSRRISVDLTAREREIAHFIVRAKSTKYIAKHLHISPRTVEAHRARLMRKYGVQSGAELMSHLMGTLSTEAGGGPVEELSRRFAR
ncbi:helix-turn-helix domain-containing protein [Burkholderia plantarii]|uniref:helix-turn-helix domain-containing protein n=1 Tax=Burkholderia plantarii TaxID=41899 RepID=UPI0011E02E5D|nr:helix-turn-helix domain-containing protein [Burkholderia plantarii]